MKFFAFQKQMRNFPLFSMHDLRLIFPRENIHTANKQISLWTRQKKLIKLKNGLYIMAPEYTKETISPEVIAAKLYSPSYISLEYALSTYGMIPESVFEITSITTKPTRRFETSVGVFSYRTIKQDCFFGFETYQYSGLPYYKAEPEKAIVDFIYLNSERLRESFQTWEDLRLENLEEINMQKLIKFAKKFNNKKLLNLILNLKEYAASS